MQSAVLPLLLALLPPAEPSAPPPDPRSVEVLRERCASRLFTRDVTLFLNGTIRLREGAPGQEKQLLREIGRPDADLLVRQLAAIDLSETESSRGGPQGEWTERCELVLALPGSGPLTLEYGRLDTGTLGLDGLRRIVETLVDQARLGSGSAEFPAGYKPAVGDVIERDDGLVFAVVGFTSDGRGVELTGTDTPLTLYLPRDEIPKSFRRLVRRAAP